jgi:hypothetical protein
MTMRELGTIGSMTVQTVVDSSYFRLTVDDPPGVARLVRKATAFPSGEVLRAAALEVERAPLPSGLALLIDARDAPARNDAEFEEQFSRARRPILARFVRVAVLVRSAVGKLQVTRYAREDGVSAQFVFDDDGEAVDYLLHRP